MENQQLPAYTKSKSRRPIFPKQQSHGQVNQQYLASYKSNVSSFSPTKFSPNHRPINSRVIIYPVQSKIIRNNSIPKTDTLPIRINFSQPKNRPVIMQRTMMQTQPLPFCPSRHIFEENKSSINQSFMQTQPNFMRSIQQSSFTKENFLRANRVLPTVVTVERVMKPLGQNMVDQIRVLKPEAHLLSPSIVPSIVVRKPEEFSTIQKINQRELQGQKISKLTEINNLLSENYEMLYEEFFNLKNSIQINSSEQNVIEERTFLNKTAHQIEAIFNLQTHTALSQIEEIYRRNKCNNYTMKNHRL